MSYQKRPDINCFQGVSPASTECPFFDLSFRPIPLQSLSPQKLFFPSIFDFSALAEVQTCYCTRHCGRLAIDQT